MEWMGYKISNKEMGGDMMPIRLRQGRAIESNKNRRKKK